MWNLVSTEDGILAFVRGASKGQGAQYWTQSQIGQFFSSGAKQIAVVQAPQTIRTKGYGAVSLTASEIYRVDSDNFGSPYECSVICRQQKAAALSKFGLTFVTDRTWSGDENLWCREFESGPLDDPENFSIPEEAFDWTRNIAAQQPAEIKLGFIDGNLVSIDDHDVALIDTIPLLNKTVGKFGHGRFVGLEHISTGEKVLEVREAPAAAIIMDALRHLETTALNPG
ncbi:argininosuccinate synthase domain-containing protein [Rhizobium sp. CCGE531]|uniref:argininosuccinate synthase domain-containing protein n=1 Tax=Rhizobium sp. CCGE531 TaxID=2364271 RepID=UPI001FE1226B|nr:argininosuccinate synthase domain-containing protein [Rhizobium sp. CCGE531]